MMKICVLGNSHIASLKNGWDRVGQKYPDIELVFFGARGAGLDGLELDGKALVAANDDLRHSLA